MADESFSAKRPRPLPLTIAAAVVGLQSVGLLASALWAWAALIPGGWGDFLVSGIALGVLLLALGGGLFLVARALWRGFRWPRAAAVAWQLLSGFVGVSLLMSGQLAGLVFLVPNVVVLVCLFTPKALAATERTMNSRG